MKKFWQFIKFGIVGVSNTLISEGVYAVLVLMHVNYIFANVLGFVLSVLNAYYWNNKYVFKEDENSKERIWWKALLKTYVAYGGTYILSLTLLILWVQVIQIEKYMGPVVELLHGMINADTAGKLIAQFVSLLITIPLNFFINKLWTFGKSRKQN